MNEDNFIHTKYGWCYFSTEGIPFIYGLFVEKQFRRKGNARSILLMVISEIRRLGFNGPIKIEATPSEDNIKKEDLIKFYKSFGLLVTNLYDGD